jgi:GH15 family glucan-1,4-alpha-glucosidase
MSRAGEISSAEGFFGWCAQILSNQAGRIRDLARSPTGLSEAEADRFLPTRYKLDGTASHEPWSNFQADGYGTWLRVLIDHCIRHRKRVDPYFEAINLTADYLNAVGTLPCYDWWEEFPDKRHTSTLAAVGSGLRAALDVGVLTEVRHAQSLQTVRKIDQLIMQDVRVTGRLNKWLGSDAVDGNLLSCLTLYNTVPTNDSVAEQTVSTIRATLLNGGVHRYVGDTFYGGGEWIILTAWLGWYEALIGDFEGARQRLDWIASRARNGLLPEQVTDQAQQPDYVKEWEQKWGPVATPLLWSHAMFVTLWTVCR